MSWLDQRPDDAMVGSFEAVGQEHIATVDPAQFREAMSAARRRRARGDDDGAGRDGAAHGDCRGVGVGPARDLLVCLNRRSQFAPILRENHVLCVNTLRAGADTIADVFAGRTSVPMAERFNSGTWTELRPARRR